MAAAREGREGAGQANLRGTVPGHAFLTTLCRKREFFNWTGALDVAHAHTRAMSRCARGTIDAGEYHVYTRSPGKIPFFRDDIDRTDFCNRLHTVVVKLRWRCLAFVLMTSHYHLVLEVEENRLQPGMKWLNGTYAQRFNKRHGRWGHLCGSRYSLVPIESRRQRLRTFRYVALNPVAADLTKRPQDWTWSSYAGTAGYVQPFRFVDDRPIRECFGDGPDGLELLRAFVEEAVEPVTKS